MVAQVVQGLELVVGHLRDPLLVLLGGAEQGRLPDELPGEQVLELREPRVVQGLVTGAVPLDGTAHHGRRVGKVVLVEHHRSGQVRRLGIGRHCGEGQRDQVRRPCAAG